MSSSTYVVDYSSEEIEKAHKVLYNEGLRMRIQVAGKEYVEKSLNAAKDPFSKPMQEVRYVQSRKSLQFV
jgi:4-carboxymuconolactone decarboxylase